MRKVFFRLFLSVALIRPAYALKEDAKPAIINVEIGKVSEVVLPETIAKVVKGGEPGSVLVEVLENTVYLLPKSENPAEIFVTTLSGESYPLILRIAKERDIKVQIGPERNSSASYRKPYSNVMDLMKDLLLGKEPEMSTPLSQEGKVFLLNGQIKLTVEKAYQMGDWTAYILAAENRTESSVLLPIEQIVLPNLLAVSSDQDILGVKQKNEKRVRVYLITGQ